MVWIFLELPILSLLGQRCNHHLAKISSPVSLLFLWWCNQATYVVLVHELLTQINTSWYNLREFNLFTACIFWNNFIPLGTSVMGVILWKQQRRKLLSGLKMKSLWTGNLWLTLGFMRMCKYTMNMACENFTTQLK